MRRRDFLRRMMATGAGVAAGAAGLEGLEITGVVHAPPAAWADTVRPQPARGRCGLWWSASPNAGRRLALTFDDGPTTQFTARVLDTLDAAGLRATFFVIGDLATRHPELLRRAHDSGHELASHSQTHVSAAVSEPAAVRDSVLRGSDTLEHLTGRRPRWFRPPRGEITTATLLSAREAELDVAMWSLGRGDAPDGDSDGVARHLRAAVHPGAVIDLHDGIGRSAWVGTPDDQLIRRRAAEITALPGVLRSWRDAGYTFMTLSELIPATAGSSGTGSPRPDHS